jgi:hypothetical protein
MAALLPSNLVIVLPYLRITISSGSAINLPNVVLIMKSYLRQHQVRSTVEPEEKKRICAYADALKAIFYA